MTIILIIVIVVLLGALFSRRNRYGGGFQRPPQNNFYRDNDPGYYPPMGGMGGMGGGMGSFMGGMAVGGLLSYLLEQGRIDAMQYNYFNQFGDQQMIQELMNQNILQQHEIDDLQRQMDGANWGQNDFGGPGGQDPYGPLPGDNYNNVDFNPGNDYNDGFNDPGYNDPGFDDNNSNGDNWV